MKRQIRNIMTNRTMDFSEINSNGDCVLMDGTIIKKDLFEKRFILIEENMETVKPNGVVSHGNNNTHISRPKPVESSKNGTSISKPIAYDTQERPVNEQQYNQIVQNTPEPEFDINKPMGQFVNPDINIQNNPEPEFDINKPIGQNLGLNQQQIQQPIPEVKKETETPATLFFKGIKKNNDTEFILRFNEKLPSVELIKALNENYEEMSFIDFLAKEYTNSLFKDRSKVENQIKEFLNNLIEIKND